MNYFVNEELINSTSGKVAAGKARQDINRILENENYKAISIHISDDMDATRENSSIVSKICYHFKLYKVWKKVLKPLKAGDKVVIQYPVINHTLFMGLIGKSLKRRNICLVLLVHDLSMLRFNMNELSKKMRFRVRCEENSMLEIADAIVSHNDIMSNYIKQNSSCSGDLISLDIFDYIVSSTVVGKLKSGNKNGPVVIAGNLAKEKAGYAYLLPSNQSFSLFGIKYSGNENSNVTYNGAYGADELPYHLEGSFGLVWDGPDANTCSGDFGNYLKFNNPHKVSLYLASGLPVIIWSHAAMAKFITENNVGLTVDSLNEIHDKIKQISDVEYAEMLRNVNNIAEKLRVGGYTVEAINKVGDIK